MLTSSQNNNETPVENGSKPDKVYKQNYEVSRITSKSNTDTNHTDYKEDLGKREDVKELKNKRETENFKGEIDTNDKNTNCNTELPESIQSLDFIDGNLKIVANKMPESKMDKSEISSKEGNSEKRSNIISNTQSSEEASITKLNLSAKLNPSENRLKNISSIRFETLINLESLTLNRRSLTSIPSSIGLLQNLKYLDLSFNRLTTLPFDNQEDDNLQPDMSRIKVLPRLHILNCSVNILTSIPKTLCMDATNLYVFEARRNRLTSIPAEIGYLNNLDKLNLNDNLIESIPKEIGNLQNLRKLYIAGNRLTSLPMELGQLPRLIGINYSHNQIEYIPPNLNRVLENQIRVLGNIYDDSQNVHDHHIQNCITASINRVISQPPLPEFDSLDKVRNYIIEDEVLEEDVKQIILEYCEDKSIHSLLGLTFGELLLATISRIEVLGTMQREHQIQIQSGNFLLACCCWQADEGNGHNDTEVQNFETSIRRENEAEKEKEDIKWQIKKVINEEMKDSLCKCFTGRMSRLIASLNGFDDLVQINISPQAQISNIIINVKNILVSANEYTVQLHQERVRKELQERGYDYKLIEENIGYIE